MHVFYRRECLLPTLELQVVLKERDREESGALEMLVMTLLARGIRTVESLSKLTGTPERALEQIITEQEGNSTIRRVATGVKLTELGIESLALGVPIRLIDRALRYCAIKSVLLPREAYSLEFRRFSDMEATFLNFRQLLPEPDRLIELGGLADVDDKFAVNLPDETVGVESLIGYHPGYLRATLCITGSSAPNTAWVMFGDRLMEYPFFAVMPLWESFDLDSQRTGSSSPASEVIADSLTRDGAILKSPVNLDGYGSPKVVLSDASDEWLSSRLYLEDPWVLICGTTDKPARPINRFPHRDILQGHTMTIYIENKELESDVNVLRDVFDTVQTTYFSRPVRERESSVLEFMELNIPRESLERTKKLVQRFKIRQARNWFGSDAFDLSERNA